MKRLARCFLAWLLVCIVLFPISALASMDYSYSLEDVFEAFMLAPGSDKPSNEDSTDTTIKVTGDYVLPPWTMLRQEITNKDSVLTLSGDMYTDAMTRINISQAIVSGFGKGNDWSKFKKELESICVYKKDTQELILINDTTSANKKFDSLIQRFDNAMLIASVASMTDVSKSLGDSKGVVIVSGVVDIIIGWIGVIAFELGRLAIACVNLIFIAELLYISVEPMRPILGFETRPRFFKRLTFRGEELDADNTRVFRIVGAAARAAVAKEYEINNNMSEVHKNNILASYMWGKSLYIFCMIAGIVLVDGKVWGKLCVAGMSLFINLA